MQEALENALAELVLGPPLDIDDTRALSSWLERHGVDPTDRAALHRKELERLLIYRRLVRSRLREVVQLAVPCTQARLGPLFDEYFDRFLKERGPRTHYLRDVTGEFLDFCAMLWQLDPRVAPYLCDLARHESLRIEIAAMQARPPLHEPGALDLEHGVEFIEAARIVRYRWAVHELADDEDDRTEPAAGDIALFVYRSPEHRVRYLELTPLAAAIVQRLLVERASLQKAVLGGCAALGFSVDSGVLEGLAHLLSDLAERGALLGSRPAASTDV